MHRAVKSSFSEGPMQPLIEQGKKEIWPVDVFPRPPLVHVVDQAKWLTKPDVREERSQGS